MLLTLAAGCGTDAPTAEADASDVSPSDDDTVDGSDVALDAARETDTPSPPAWDPTDCQIDWSLGNDPTDCGGCGACETGAECVLARCVHVDDDCDDCSTPNVCCDGECLDPGMLSVSEQHCGDCGIGCGDGEQCTRFQCVEVEQECGCGPDAMCCPEVESGELSCMDDGELTFSATHCGGCEPCRDGETCAGGACTCLRDECDDACVEFDTDPMNCGGCGQACGDSAVCFLGDCVEMNAFDCDEDCPYCCLNTWSFGECTDLISDDHCGACGQTCERPLSCVRSRADATGDLQVGCGCNPSESRDIGLCDGQCSDLRLDRLNCGSCGNICTDVGAACVNGECVTGESDACGDRCDPGEVCCGSGRCVDGYFGDDDDCGGCGLQCADDRSCRSRECRCDSGFDCDGECTYESALNCGGCGIRCGDAEQCTGREGSMTCSCTDWGDSPLGFVECDGACTDLLSEATCGDCATACEPGEWCSEIDLAATCNCPVDAGHPGFARCDEVCTDLMTSDGHCGACDAACEPGLTCQSGACCDPSGGPNGCCEGPECCLSNGDGYRFAPENDSSVCCEGDPDDDGICGFQGLCSPFREVTCAGDDDCCMGVCTADHSIEFGAIGGGRVCCLAPGMHRSPDSGMCCHGDLDEDGICDEPS